MRLDKGKYPKPQDYKTKEEMILPYVEALGSTQAITAVIEFLESHTQLAAQIRQKSENRANYAIGEGEGEEPEDGWGELGSR